MLEQLSYVATILGSAVTACAAVAAFLAIRTGAADARRARELQSDIALFDAFERYIASRPSFFEGEVGEVGGAIWNHTNSTSFMFALLQRRAEEKASSNPKGSADPMLVKMTEQLKSASDIAHQHFLDRWTRMSKARGFDVETGSPSAPEAQHA